MSQVIDMQDILSSSVCHLLQKCNKMIRKQNSLKSPYGIEMQEIESDKSYKVSPSG